MGEGEFLQSEGGEKVIHTYYDIEEAEAHFKDMKISYNIATPLKLSHADTLDVNLRANRIYAICGTYTGEVVSGYIPVPHHPQPLSYYLKFNREISVVRNRIKSMVLLEVFDNRVNLICIRVW